MPISATTGRPSFIDATRMYSLRQFVVDSGISLTRIRQAARHGLELRKVKTGKRVFVRGQDGIDFIEKLAELQIEQAATRQANEFAN